MWPEVCIFMHLLGTKNLCDWDAPIFYRWENGSSQKLNNFFKVTKGQEITKVDLVPTLKLIPTCNRKKESKRVDHSKHRWLEKLRFGNQTGRRAQCQKHYLNIHFQERILRGLGSQSASKQSRKSVPWAL